MSAGNFSSPRRLGGEPRHARALGVELRAQQVEGGVHAHVLDDDQRLALLHARAVAHQDLAHDAAFLVLHHLAVQVHLDEALRDHRARERREHRPAADADHADPDHRQAREQQAPHVHAGVEFHRRDEQLAQPPHDGRHLRPPRAPAARRA